MAAQAHYTVRGLAVPDATVRSGRGLGQRPRMAPFGLMAHIELRADQEPDVALGGS